MSTDDTQKDELPEPVRPSPLTIIEIADLVRAVLAGGCSIIPTEHFKKRGRERDFSIRDALEVLRTGTVSPTPLWNERTESWNYDIGGVDIEGDPLTVRIAPTTSGEGLIFVTAF